MILPNSHSPKPLMISASLKTEEGDSCRLKMLEMEERGAESSALEGSCGPFLNERGGQGRVNCTLNKPMTDFLTYFKLRYEKKIVKYLDF